MDHTEHMAPAPQQAGLSTWERIQDTFSEYGFMPHGHCYLWKPLLVSLHVISDALIGFAYLCISLTLYWLVKQIQLPFNRVAICFGVFIGACGLTHFMEIWNLWNADYWWAAWVKVITAFASVGTGVYLFKLRHSIVDLAKAAKLSNQRKIDLEELAKRLEKTVEVTSRDLTVIADNIPQLAWKADPDGTITWYNKSWYDYTGSNIDEMRGWGWQKVHHPEHEPRVTAKWKQHLQDGEPWEDTFPLKGKDGQWRWFLSRAKPIRDDEGNILQWFGTNTDITDQLKAQNEKEQLLRELAFEKKRFETVISQMPAAVIIADAPSGKIVYANAKVKDVWGYDPIMSNSIDEYREYKGYHPDGSVVQATEWPLARSIQNGEVVQEEEFEIDRGNGEAGFVRISSAPVKDDHGTTVAAVVMSYDVTQNFKLQRKIFESEEKFRTIANAMPQMVWSTLPNGEHDYFNDQWYSFTGALKGSSDGHKWSEFFHPEDQPRAIVAWTRSLQTGEPYEIEYRLKHRTGNFRWVLGRALPIRDEDGTVIRWMGTCTDIHEQKLVNAELEQKTAELQSLLENSPLGLATFDHEYRYVRINHALAEINGVSAEDHIGKTIREVLPVNAPKVEPIIDKVYATGETVEVEVEGETHRDPGMKRYWLTGFYPVIIDNKVRSVGAFVLEISDLRRVEAELKKAVYARDEFLSIASHELKTPMTSLLLNTQLIKKQAEKNGVASVDATKLLKFVETVDRQVVRLNRLVDDMLDISRIQTGKLAIHPSTVDIAELLKDIKLRFDPQFVSATGSDLGLKIMDESVKGVWDRLRIEQVVSNLLTNALKYGNKKPVNMNSWVEKDSVFISVQDQGKGISEENLNIIFNRFERAGISADEISGLGLGLYITKQIVSAHGGEIWAKSEVGSGSTFTVRFPLKVSKAKEIDVV